MAVRLDAAADQLYRTANLPAIAGPWTMTCWYNRAANNAYGIFLNCFSGGTGYTAPSLVLGHGGGGSQLTLYNDGAGAASGSTPSLNTWYPIWIVRGAAANRTDVYFNFGTSPDMQNTNTFSGTPNRGLQFGSAGSDQTDPWNGRVAAVKWWDAALSVEELVQEGRFYRPLRTANLQGFYPCFSIADDEIDYSGLGRDFTIGGTLATEDGPPIAWGPGRRRYFFSSGVQPATIKRFVKTDSTARSQTSDTAVEETNYTIPWATLTNAGLAASDDVIVLVWAKLRGSSATNYVRFQVGLGTTYAGRTDQADSYMSWEPFSTTTNRCGQYFWMDRRTLVVDENLYFSLWSSGGSTGTAQEFVCVILKLGDLTTNDFAYAEATHSGNAPTSYDTSGASFTTPAAGDWLLLAFTKWLDDSISANYLMAISAGGTDYSEVSHEGEDTENSMCRFTMAYRASLASDQTCQVRYRTDSATHDCEGTKIFGLRLNAFKDHWGVHATDTITHSVIDTYQDFAANASYSASQTGHVFALGWPIHPLNGDVNKTPYGRILLDTTEWPAAGANRSAVVDNGADAIHAPFLFGYESIGQGTRSWEFECAEDADVTPNYSCTTQVAAIFSVALAPVVTGGLFRPSSALTGLRTGGPFFADPLAAGL